MTNGRSNQLLGELLKDAGLLQIDDLREASFIARGQGLPIGKVLVMSCYISKEVLQAAVEVQARIKDDLLNYESALEALKIVGQTNGTLDEALRKLGKISSLPRAADTTTNRLGALLLDSALLTKSDFDGALSESQRCGLPLGRVLTNLSILPDSVIDVALKVQKLLRNGQISKEDAIRSLLQTKDRIAKQQYKADDIPAPQRLASASIDDRAQNNRSIPPEQNTADLKPLSLHHVLRIAGLIDTNALENAIKDGLEDPEVMGLILRRSGLLEDFVIAAAKECCQLISSGELKPEQAIIALHQCQRTRNSIRDCLEEYGWGPKAETVW